MKSIVNLLFLLFITHVAIAQPAKEVDLNYGTAKNIILMIGDGMGVSQIYAGITANNGSLNIEQFKVVGFSKTYAADDYVTDSGAGGTAIAIGQKTYSKAIGVDNDTIPRKTILEYAEEHHKVTGIVATSQVTHATPASFVAHQKHRYMYEEIAADFLKSNIDVFIGGGLNHFAKRKDSLDLIMQLRNKGYQIAYSELEMEDIHEGKLAGLFYDNEPPRYSDGRNEMLVKSTNKAIELLSKDKNGFFLLIEGSQIDWGAHDNDTEYVVEEMLDFDNAIGAVLDFARQDKNTLVIVTADHETGGMAINDGNFETGEVTASYTTGDHTGIMVPVFAYGPGAENFGGFQENTDLFLKMLNAFGFKLTH